MKKEILDKELGDYEIDPDLRSIIYRTMEKYAKERLDENGIYSREDLNPKFLEIIDQINKECNL